VDRNTKFFHESAKQKRGRNEIEKIVDAEGVLREDPQEVESALVNYFSSLFTSDYGGENIINLQGIEGRVTPEMNVALVKEFSKEEIKEALNQMSPLKALSLDGLSALQDHWDMVGEEVCQAVLSSLNSSFINNELNFTNIALISKIANPSNVSEFHPISLCNVVYKILSKVLANRLKLILLNIISPYQSAFIPGRLITDNVLIAYETLHTMHFRMYGRKGHMAIKLDMSKAYDMVKWRFLEEVMRRMGFVEN
jgi:hypothetical protein